MLDVEAAKKTKTYIGKKRQLGDKNWRIDNLYSILGETGAVLPFKRNEAQMAYSPQRHSRDVIAKARKLGFSTFIDLKILDTCMFRTNITAGIIDAKLDDA